jgi:hypothetical protein
LKAEERGDYSSQQKEQHFFNTQTQSDYDDLLEGKVSGFCGGIKESILVVCSAGEKFVPCVA